MMQASAAYSTDGILGQLLKEANKHIHLIDGELSREATHRLHKENTSLHEELFNVKIEVVKLDHALNDVSHHRDYLHHKSDDLSAEVKSFKDAWPRKVPFKGPPKRAQGAPLTSSNVSVHNHASQLAPPKGMQVPFSKLIDGHYGPLAAPIPPGPQGPTQHDDNRDLIPSEYSWFQLLDQSCQPSTGMWRNVPIPGSFSINNFQDRVVICGQLWVMQGQNDICQW
ncbi:uncharacterized protein EI90DRAFT_3019746 [Cantharellus anzutake]|uniref:uncharacterized protein n=1 Tax=Cantharellus anzutake TaxID=1750568 RepID=UPI001907F0D2|nr:uncharacterized protein EI90DRAFT_3019746 [Cantharellus anzutake]KAF8324190.1 hypothetical protein EI90DRAFT_3019746 [Cantharellus anzutake]